MGKINNNLEGTMPMPMPLPLPPLLRDFIASFLSTADNYFLSFTRNYKLLQTLRFILANFYLFLLRFLPSFFINTYDAAAVKIKPHSHKYAHDTRAPKNDTAIGRALTQLLSTLNDIPVSSRKYETVRSLAEKIIDDNHMSGVHALREVNRVVLSGAFGRALRQLEAKAAENGEGGEREGEKEREGECYYSSYRLRMRWIGLRRLVRVVGWSVRGGGGGDLSGVPAEKLAAELVWMAQKMVDCGFAEEALRRWAAASKLGCLALSAHPRLQTSLVKLAGMFFYSFFLE